jgi:cell division cycle protein 20 (cofactor of APC complex)
VEKFDRKGNFSMWKCEVMDILVQINLDFTLEDKPKDLDDKSWERINRLACSSIRLCLVKDQKYVFFRTKLCKGIMASIGGQVYEKEYRESSLLEEKDLPFSAQERYFHE